MRRIAILLPALGVLCLGAAAPAQRIVPGGQTYVSPNKLFSVTPLKPSNWTGLRYEVRTEGERGEPEIVTFHVPDFGELYKAGLVFGEPALAAVADRAAVATPEQAKSPPELIEESRVETHLGPGVLRLYLARNNSLLVNMVITDGRLVPARADSYIAVLAVPLPGRVAFATATDDNFGMIEKRPASEWQAWLKQRVREFLATMKLSE